MRAHTVLLLALFGLSWANTSDTSDKAASSAKHLLRTRSLVRACGVRVDELESSFAELLTSEEREVSARCSWRMEHSPSSGEMRDFVSVHCRPSCDLSMENP